MKRRGRTLKAKMNRSFPLMRVLLMSVFCFSFVHQACLVCLLWLFSSLPLRLASSSLLKTFVVLLFSLFSYPWCGFFSYWFCWWGLFPRKVYLPFGLVAAQCKTKAQSSMAHGTQIKRRGRAGCHQY
jgi:hypothetical protein